MTTQAVTSTQGQGPTSDPGQVPNPQQGQEPTQHGAQGQNDGGQEPRTFDEDYVRRLRAEAAGYRTELQGVRTELQQIRDRDLTDQQRLERERDELRSRLTPLEQKVARYEVAAATGLPLNLAERLQGDTREALEKDADELKKQFGIGQEPGRPNFDAGARPPVQTNGDDFNSLIRRAAGRSA